MPIKPFNAEKAAGIWKIKESDAMCILNDLADRGILIDTCENDNVIYSLPPPMAVFFEFSLMRYRNDIDQKAKKVMNIFIFNNLLHHPSQSRNNFRFSSAVFAAGSDNILRSYNYI